MARDGGNKEKTVRCSDNIGIFNDNFTVYRIIFICVEIFFGTSVD